MGWAPRGWATAVGVRSARDFTRQPSGRESGETGATGPASPRHPGTAPDPAVIGAVLGVA